MSKDINILRTEMIGYNEQADKYCNDGMLSNSCNELKLAIAKAEEIFHITNSIDDKNVLLELYMKIAKYFSKIYTITCNKKDILPSCMYYEKLIYFYEEELNNSSKNKIVNLNKIMEVYVQLLWVCLEINDYQSFERFIPKAYKYALKLLRISKVYEDEQYFILVNIFKGDYYKALDKYKTAYLYYLVAMKKMKNIYKKLPNEGLLNDLIIIYNNLSDIAKHLKRSKDKIKWDTIISKLEKESEMFNNGK